MSYESAPLLSSLATYFCNGSTIKHTRDEIRKHSVASPVPQRLRISNKHDTQCLVKVAAHHMALFVSDRSNKGEVFFGKLSKL